MSVKAISWVFEHSQAELGSRLVLIALADHASDDGRGAWPSLDTIAKKARMSERHARRCLRELEKSGEIIRRGKSPYGTHIYDLNMGGDNMSGGGQIVQEGGTNRAEGVTQMSPEPSLRSTVKEPSDNLPAAPGSSPPKLVKVDGRDLAFDALAEVCEIREGSPRMKHAAVALNGPDGIRAQAHRERPLPDSWTHEHWERWLANEVRERAALYRRKMTGVMMTPTALAKWWTDLPGLPDPGGKSGSAADVVGAIDAAVRQERGQ